MTDADKDEEGGICSQAQKRRHIAPQPQLGAAGMICDEHSSQGNVSALQACGNQLLVLQ